MPAFDHKLSKPFYDFGKRNLQFWSVLTRRGLFAFLFAYLGIWFVSDKEFYTSLSVLLSLAVSFLIAFVVRYIIRRPRPHFDSSYTPWLKAWSFPSAHSAIAFALATSISLLAFDLFQTPIVWIGVVLLYASASMIAISRLAVGVHYLTDIIAGALIGILTSVILIGL